MLGNRFYNQSLRKLIIAFGQVFNNIVIQRTNSTGGVTARIKVPPVSYTHLTLPTNREV